MVLTATICGINEVIVGLVRSWGDPPFIALCELCEWRPDEIQGTETRKLVAHLSECHDLPPEQVGFVSRTGRASGILVADVRGQAQ